MTRRQRCKRVLAFLCSPPSPGWAGEPGSDVVAARLTALGVRGESGKPDSCPVALALRACVGGPWAVGIGSAGVRVPEDVRRRLAVPSYAVMMPEGCRAFVHRFDGGAFPWLERGGAQ